MDKLLKLIEKNARMSTEEIAAILGENVADVAQKFDEYKAAGIIRGTRTLIDWGKAGGGNVQAIIEVRVTPKKGHGFDEIACIIAAMDEVDGVQLMSGGYDLTVYISGKSFQEVALFVARRLSLIEGVLSTATHFVLATYKKDGALYNSPSIDERLAQV